jgi:hypothetical protein
MEKRMLMLEQGMNWTISGRDWDLGKFPSNGIIKIPASSVTESYSISRVGKRREKMKKKICCSSRKHHASPKEYFLFMSNEGK